jgi:hypothetical protein
MCVAGVCECGKENQTCCSIGTACSDPTTACITSTTTSQRTCLKCGKDGQACCTTGTACTDAGDVCGVNATTGIRTCMKCGAAGAPCCANNSCSGGGCCVYTYQSSGYLSVCTGAASICPTSSTATATCATGSCGTCGGASQPCCYSSNVGYYVCTAPNTYCPSQSSTALCQPCGGQGQPCCGANSNSVSSSSTGTCTTGLSCRLGTTTYTCQT